MDDWTAPGWLVLSALAAVLSVVLLLVLVLVRTRAQTTRELSKAHAETALLRGQVAEIEKRLALPRIAVRDHPDYVITDLGEQESPDRAPAPRLEAPLFADLVLRETVVQAASLVHGLRRALAAESRNRIRFEMRREVRASRKRRRREMKGYAQRARAGRGPLADGDAA